ncbi:MAG: hypothetical protein KDK71_09565, partial [Chlamydiia bacterium]|nr:hypothetical protein [Chlamydiia bacterium]
MLKNLLGIVFFLGVCGTVFGAVRGAYPIHFALEGDYILLRRRNSHNKHLAAAAGGPIHYPISAMEPNCAKEVGKPFIETRDLVHDMNYNGGFAVALKIFPSIYSTWEARYIGGLAWTGQQTKSCLENINLDGNIADRTRDYLYASRVKAVYDSDLYSYELNYYRHITPRYTDHFSVSWLIGARAFSIDEKIKMHFHNADRTSRYRAKTYNDSYGLQLG